MTDLNVTWFRSKVDWWLGVILVALPLIEIGAFVAALRSGEREGIVAALVGIGIVTAIYALLIIPIRYGLSREELIVRFGVVRSRIRLADILEVYPTHNPLSSPALSLDRLAIRTKAGPFGLSLVSPSQREEFLTELAARADLVREGGRLVRGTSRAGSA
jgi:hypothetical protein